MIIDKQHVEYRLQFAVMVWLYLGKTDWKGAHKKLKNIRYGSFKILEKYDENAFKLDLLWYMHMYLAVNVENLWLFEPSRPCPWQEDKKTWNGGQTLLRICPKGQFSNQVK